MSLQTQTAHMKTLAELLGQDLGYIHGERETGPNGAKRQFLSKGRAFLSALGRDLGLTEQKIVTNKAGIAVSGEVSLRGLWEPGNGLRVELSQDLISGYVLRFGPIMAMNDHAAGFAAKLSLETLRRANYAALLVDLLAFREGFHEPAAA